MPLKTYETFVTIRNFLLSLKWKLSNPEFLLYWWILCVFSIVHKVYKDMRPMTYIGSNLPPHNQLFRFRSQFIRKNQMFNPQIRTFFNNRTPQTFQSKISLTMLNGTIFTNGKQTYYSSWLINFQFPNSNFQYPLSNFHF